MAIAQNSIVALARTGAAGLQGFLGKKPLFGRVTDAAAPWDVLWENGVTAASIPAAQLDEINFTATDPLVVRIEATDGDTVSGYYDCVVVARYTRTTGGSSLLGTFYLLKSVNTDQYFEVPVAAVSVLEDR